MEFFGAIFHVLFYQPIFNLLMFFYSLLGNNLGLAIVAIAVLSKVITIPITRKQIENAKKMKNFQIESKKIKEKYGKNTEKMNQELMKVSSKYMPAQLAGCLPLIITILLFIQIRSVVINLVDQGYHAYNQVAYFDDTKIPEDSILYEPEDDLPEGENRIKYVITASDGHKLEKEVVFFNEDNEDTGKDKSEEFYKNRSEEDVKIEEGKVKTERESGIALFIENFKDGSFVTDDTPSIKTFLRPPSDERIESVEIFVNDENVTEEAEINEGEPINLELFGMNLARTGSEFIGRWNQFIPYIVLAFIFAISQFFVGRLQMGLPAAPEKPKQSDKTDKKKKEESEPDFAEVMQKSSQQMMYIMPFMTFAMSLGYLGGATLFPSGVSLFWTAQNAFVIIQQIVTKRSEKNNKSKGNSKVIEDEDGEIDEPIENEVIEADELIVTEKQAQKNKKLKKKNKKKKK